MGRTAPRRPGPARAAPERSGNRPQPPEGECRHRQRPGVPRIPGAGRLVRPLSLGLRGRYAEAIPSTHAARSAGPLPGVRRDECRPGGARLPLRGTHHLLRLHAGRRDGERPPRHLLPPRRGPAPQPSGAVGKTRGGRRAFVACSYANASLISTASVHGRPTNESPTGNPRTCPIGTVTW